MKQITKVRKAVCAMANQLRKTGYSLKIQGLWTGILSDLIKGTGRELYTDFGEEGIL